MPTRNEFSEAAEHLQAALVALQRASRLITRGAADVQHLTRNHGLNQATIYDKWPRPSKCALPELVEAATKIGALSQEVGQFAAWMALEDESA